MNFAKRARDNYFTLNGRSSADWGIVASNDNGFDAPERDVSAIEVPGRNGELHIDNGRWRNIDVTYNDCVIERDFTERFGDFRAFCARQRGYQRLEDTFHPDEYRLADMTQGIKVEKLGTRYNAGRFDITFNCKPQRFLKSGEEPIVLMSWGDLNGRQYNIYHGRGGQFMYSEGTEIVIEFRKVSQTSENIEFHGYCFNDDQDSFPEYSATITDSTVWRSGATASGMYRFGYSMLTTTDDGIHGWEIRIGFTNYDGDEINGIMTDHVDIVNPTGFDAFPLIVSNAGNSINFYDLIFEYENENGEFVKTYMYKTISRTLGHGGTAYMDCENQYCYYIENDASRPSGKKYVSLEIERYDYASGDWTPTDFPCLGEKTTRLYTDIIASLDEPESDFPAYLPICTGDDYKMIYPRWYTI